MKQQFIIAMLVATLILPPLSSVFGQEGGVESSGTVNVDTGQLDTRARVRVNVQRAQATAQTAQDRLNAQREAMKTQAQTRKVQAEASGDEARAKREDAKVGQESKRAEMDAQREAKHAEMEAKRAANKAKREEFKQDIAKRKVAQVVQVAKDTILRLERIITRLESRIDKVNQKGGNTTEAVSYVALAKGTLAEARTAIDAMGNIDLSGADAQANFEQIRNSAAAVRELIRAAHGNLMLAVRSLSSVEIDVEGSSIAE